MDSNAVYLVWVLQHDQIELMRIFPGPLIALATRGKDSSFKLAKLREYMTYARIVHLALSAV